MKFSDLAQKFPGIFTDDKGPLDFNWRYPGGEVIILLTHRIHILYFVATVKMYFLPEQCLELR